MLANRAGHDDGFALITLAPPAGARVATPRDVTFVLDVSGSMSGRKMEQARAAGRQLLATLSPRDRFRIIDFSSDVRTFRDELIDATPANLRAANEYLDASVRPAARTSPAHSRKHCATAPARMMSSARSAVRHRRRAHGRRARSVQDRRARRTTAPARSHLHFRTWRRRERVAARAARSRRTWHRTVRTTVGRRGAKPYHSSRAASPIPSRRTYAWRRTAFGSTASSRRDQSTSSRVATR